MPEDHIDQTAEILKCLMRALEKHIPGLRDEVRDELEIRALTLAEEGRGTNAEFLRDLVSQPFFRSRPKKT